MTKEGATTAVQVALRIRPLTERDRAQPRFANLSNDDVLKLHNKTVQVVPQNKLFTFDHVFGTTSTQEEIFAAIGDNLIRKFIEGYNVTILAYGQTSSGKTYTMGTAAHGSGINPANEGIVPRSMALLFDLLHNADSSNRPISPTSSISSSTTTSTKSNSRLRPKSRIANRSSHVPHTNNNNSHKSRHTIKVSFIEIYNEDLHDLLNSASPEESPPINIREDTKGRIYWTGVKEVLVHSTDDVLYYLEQGTQNRATGATDMNEKSSRSHAIFSVSLKQEKWVPSDINSTKKPTRPASSLSNRSPSRLSNNNNNNDEGEWLITTSKFHFVDLAGSERLKRTAAEGNRRKEGININAGLLALGNVISALGDASKKNAHVPYRDSKLTRLLQDSLGGSATTMMIACASPAEYNLAETLNTLQYANRARNIKNKSEKNQVEEWMTTENIELLRSLIGKLKNELSYLKSHHHKSQAANDDLSDDSSTVSSSTPSIDELYQEQRSLIADLQRQVEELDGEAAVTRERNKIVEKELQRLRLLESVAQTKQEQVDFQHLVEPVIEEYEKSVAKLESQLAMTRAALNHSDIGFEEQQNKILQLEGVIRAQEQSISDLRSRLSKILEREQSNESYIQELEGKLMKSAQDASKDQEMLNELKNRIMKLKETDENTEQYISNLEQRLAAADAERTRLLALVEELEAKVEARERKHMEVLKKFSKQTADSSTTEKLMLKELDEANVKYSELVKDHDALQVQLEQLQKEVKMQVPSEEPPEPSAEERNGTETRRLSISSSSGSSKYKTNRKSFANENETASSAAALSLIQTETRLKEETDRANYLQMTLDRLQDDHEATTKELDEVLQRYHETLEQLDFLERTPDVSLDLNKEIAQAKETQEKQDYTNQIDELTHKIQSLNKKIAIKDSELEMANDAIKKLQERKQDDEELKTALALEKEQVSHWKRSYEELKKDMAKLAQDLDEKEQYISELKNQLESDPRSQEEVVSLQKRLAETLGSLTVLKIAHEGLQKKLQQQPDNTELESKLKMQVEDAQNKHFSEREKLIEEHNSELLQLTQSFEATCKDLKSQIVDLEQHYANEKDKFKQLEGSSEKEKSDLRDRVLHLEEELEISKNLQDQIVAEHEAEILDLSNNFEQVTRELEEQISELESEVEASKNLHESTAASLNDQMRDAQLVEAQETEQKFKQQLEALQSELQGLKTSQQGILDEHAGKLESVTADHAAVNQKLEKEVEALKKSLEAAELNHANTLSQLTAEHKQVLEDHVQTSERDITKIKSENGESQQQLKANMDELISQLRELQSKSNEQVGLLKEQHKEALESQLKAAEAIYSETLAKINNEHHENQQQLQARIEELTSQLESKHTQDAADQDTNKQQIDALQMQLKDTETKHLDYLTKLNNDYDEERREFQSHIDVLSSQLSDLENQLATNDNTMEQRVKQLETQHKKQINELQSQLETGHSESLADIRHEHDEKQRQLQEQIHSLKADMENEKTGLTEEIKHLTVQLSDAHLKEEAMQTKINDLQVQLDKQLEAERLKKESDKALEAARTKKPAPIKITTTTNNNNNNNDGVASRIKMLESQLSTPLPTKLDNTNERIRALEQESAAKEEEMVARHEEMLDRIKTQYEKELEIQLESIEQMTREHDEELQNKQKNHELLIAELEGQVKQVQEENLEYTALSGELEKEMTRMTREMEGLTEDLERSEDRLNDIKSLLGVSKEEQVLVSLKQIVNERSEMSKKLAEAQQQQPQEQGSGVVDNSSAERYEELQKKYEESERARRKLEKQIEEFLNKKSSFLCF